MTEGTTATERAGAQLKALLEEQRALLAGDTDALDTTRQALVSVWTAHYQK